jgi:membrane protein
MAAIRAVLLAIIGLLSGAWLGLDALKNGAKQAARNGLPAPKPFKPRKRDQARLAAHQAKTTTAAVASRAGHVVSRVIHRNKQHAGADEAPPKPASAPAGRAAHTDIREISGWFGYLKELFKRFGADHCPAWAAALSFFSILSIAPILLCALAILGFVIQDPAEAQRQVERALAGVLPGAGKSAREQAHVIAEQLKIGEAAKGLRDYSSTAGLIGLLSLVWASMQIFINATTPMNAAFGTEETRGWFKLRGIALFLLVVVGFLFLLALVPSSGAQIINALRLPFIGRLPDPLPPILAFLLSLVGVAINAVMFSVVYRYLPSPSAKIDWKEARFAGVIVAVLWEIAKQAFAFYLRRFGQAGYNKMYGSLGGLVGGIFWIFYTSMILLLGAEIAKLYSDWRDAKGHKTVGGRAKAA